jgi:hypothetical protein
VEISSDGDGFSSSEDELFSAIAGELGPEAAEAFRRSHERSLHPRELTDAERTELRTTLDPVLRDLRTSGAIVPDVREQAWDDDPDFVFAFIGSDSSGLGIRVELGLPAAERVADLADQVQEWEVEELAAEGRPATWPECPEHPDSHPLAPVVRDSDAVWSCPRSGHVIQPIGALGLPSPVKAEVRDQILGPFLGKVELGAVDFDHLSHRGHHLPQPVGPLDVEWLIAGTPDQQRWHVQGM